MPAPTSPNPGQTDVRDLLEAASRVTPTETDPVAAVLRRSDTAPRRLPAPDAHRRTTVVAAATVLAVAASGALVAVAVTARDGDDGGPVVVAGPGPTADPTPSGDSTPDPTDIPRPGPTQPPGDMLAMALGTAPLDLDVAHTLLVDECAAAQGVDTTRDTTTNSSQQVNRWPSQLTQWLASGWVTGPTVDLGQLADSAQDAYNAASAGADPQEVTFPLGEGGSVSIPVSGCYGQATAELYGVPAQQYETTAARVRALEDDVLQQVRNASTVVAALPAWSACMADAGVVVEREEGAGPPSSPDELDALSAQAQRDGGEAAFSALADADLGCKQSSGLAAAAELAISGAEEALSDTDRTVLQEWATAKWTASSVIAERAAAEQASGGDGVWTALAS